jgi:hypothetical protein
LRKELGLQLKEPPWLRLPAMMRMVLTTPNVLKNRRPDWLGPFNFFLFPIISEKLGEYPAGFDKSNFFFVTPMESDRRKWSTLVGINLFDRQTYQISMSPSETQDKVVPESFRIILNQYVNKEEAKSLGPDGMPCTKTTRGLLGRARTQNNSCGQGNGSKLGAWWRPALAGSPTSHTGTAKEHVRG